MPRIAEAGSRRALALAAALATAVAGASPALAQSSVIPGQARATGRTPNVPPNLPSGGGDWPKIGFETVASLDYAGFGADEGPGRGPAFDTRFDSTFLAEFNDTLSLDGLFQFKSREPRPLSDPNRDLFINQGAGRRNGGKMKELYIRYGDWRAGKFVQDFGRAYALAPGPYAADFVEETEQGYEPSDMIGVEKIHVFDNEQGGWRQLSLSAFMVDRTFLHESFPYNEGMIRYRDGGVGNTRWPENLMATYDVLNRPVGHWAHMNYQASVIRWGKTYGADKGELWGTLGGDITIPLTGTVADTLRGGYSQLRFYVEAVRRHNFEGLAGRDRDFLTASAEYMRGRWVLDLATTQRWTHGAGEPRQKDELYTTTVGYTLPTNTVAALSVARESVGPRSGVYAGLRLTQTLTTCSRCLVKGRYY